MRCDEAILVLGILKLRKDSSDAVIQIALDKAILALKEYKKNHERRGSSD